MLPRCGVVHDCFLYLEGITSILKNITHKVYLEGITSKLKSITRMVHNSNKNPFSMLFLGIVPTF